MKFSTMTVVLAAALCMAGCKYDKAAKGGVPGANASEISTSADINADEGSLDSLSEAKFDDLYAKCTDVDFAAVYFGFDSTVIPQGELGKVDIGGGGTVAKYIANLDVDTVDLGVPVLSMHAPFEVVSKLDVYAAHRAFTALLARDQ